jgi:outer membrane protein TolC
VAACFVWPITGCRSSGSPPIFSDLSNPRRPAVGVDDFAAAAANKRTTTTQNDDLGSTESSSMIRQTGFQESANNAADSTLQLNGQLPSARQIQETAQREATSNDAARDELSLRSEIDDLEDGAQRRTSNAGDDDPEEPEDPYGLKTDRILPLPETTFGSLENADLPRSKLVLPDVLLSVSRSYPEIEIAIGEIESANGKVLAAWGEFDTIASAHSISQPLGFYQTYRNGVGLTRPLYEGGEVYSTYRIGDGNFEPWYGERETNEGGEFKAGFSLPVLKDRFIDKRRADLLKSGAQRREVRADVESRLLLFQRFATQAYWDWVAAGRAVLIQRQLLGLANERVENIRFRVEAKDLAIIAELSNNQFISKRQYAVVAAERGLEKAAIKLSIFNRDASGVPIIATPNQLPDSLPAAGRLTLEQIIADANNALAIRPELVALQAARESACIDRRYAENLMLPKLDMKGFLGQDVGGETSSLGDKTPFEAQLGIFAEVPIERRSGLGKRQAALGKINQIDAKTRIVQDKIRAEIQDAASALNASYDQIQQAQQNVELAEKSLRVAREELFESGDIDLLSLNIYETLFADARLKLLDAQFKYFVFQAIYETAISGQARFE